MSLKLLSFLGLVVLFVLAQISTFLFNIVRNRFYSPFHFAGGFLSALFFFSIVYSYFFALFLTAVLGVVWEAYEYLAWKFVLKKKRFKPERRDTINDLILDVLGGLSALAVLRLVSG